MGVWVRGCVEMSPTLRVSPWNLPVFAAAALLFAIEPMLGKLLLPSLGGSPATWAACLVAFQVLLLLGYCYAYAGARWLSVRHQVLAHGVLLLVAIVTLLATRLSAPPVLAGLPPALAVPWLIARRVGLPFVLLASSTPLAARWAAARGRPFVALYAVSNAGSLLGLLGYPLLLERFVALPAQLALWAAAFVLVGSSWLVLCALLLHNPVTNERVVARSTPWRTRWHWLALSAVPSALLVAITNHITVDVAAAPLLWVAPLALYLASFVLAFSRWASAARAPALVAWLGGSAWLAVNALGQGAVPLGQQLVAALLALGGGALLCHGELARRAPIADASGFYVVLALGGALGGCAVSLLAPLVLSDFYELELASVGLFALLLPLARRDGDAALPRLGRLALLLGAGLCLPLLVGEVWARHQASGRGGRVVERRRSFLGPLKVVDTAQGRLLLHGRIQHGMQLREPKLRRTPTMYFGAGTAIARVLDAAPGERPRRWGVVGLGVGTLASYARPHDNLRFYELDRNVIELARRDFTFLSDAPASIDIVEGDGRLALAREAPHAFDVLVLDAFTSDAVPVHLLTHEAFEIYARQLAPDGVLLANVSNRHLAVDRVVRASAHTIGLACEIVETPTRAAGHVTHVAWAVMARDPARLAETLGDLPRSPHRAPDVLWTDNRASLLSVLR